MTKKEYDEKFNAMYSEYQKFDYRSDEARKLWSDFYSEMNEAKRAFKEKKDRLIDRIFPTLNFPKLSKAQERVVRHLIGQMYEAKLGKECMINHYEIWEHGESTTDHVFELYDQNIFFDWMNTKTLDKLKEMNIIKVVSIGGSNSDHMIPLFDFEIGENDRI